MRSFSFRLMALLALVLMVGLSACAPKTAKVSAVEDNLVQAGNPAGQPAVMPTVTPGKGAAATIHCYQLIPPNEARSLMTGLSPVLSEGAGQGEITCTWQYTSKVSGQAAAFKLQVRYGGSAVDTWQAARKSELTGQSSDLVVNSIDGLRDENYIWTSKPDNQTVVYVRRGTQTMIMHYQATDILFMGTESGIIDMADRMFNRLDS
jgi:hypothetical protein